VAEFRKNLERTLDKGHGKMGSWEGGSGEETKLKKVIVLQRAMTKKVVSFGDNRCRPKICSAGRQHKKLTHGTRGKKLQSFTTYRPTTFVLLWSLQAHSYWTTSSD